VQLDLVAGRDVGEPGVLVQQQGQVGTLPQMSRRRASADELLSLGQEIVREAGAIARKGTGHEDRPGERNQRASMNHSL